MKTEEKLTQLGADSQKNKFVPAYSIVVSCIATVGLVGAGAGVGIVFAGLMIAYGRNPSLKNELFGYAVLGFALSEATGLFALMMAFLILFS